MGRGHPEWKRGERNLEDYIKDAVTRVFSSTGLSGKDMDRVCVGNFIGQLTHKQGHLGAAVVGADAALAHKPSARFEAACASGSLAFESAVQYIQAGSDAVLVVGVEVQTPLKSKEGAEALATAAHFSRQSGIDAHVWPAMFARKSKAYFEKYPQANDLHLASQKAYDNAKLNPYAHMHAHELSPKDIRESKTFVENKELHPHVRLSDCSQVTDGASAVILVSEDALQKFQKSLDLCIEVLHVAQCTDNLYEDRDDTQLKNISMAARQAYRATHLTPSDMDVAEVHDCFTMAEVMMYEALGFAPPGKGLDLLRKGDTSITGKIPVNTGGGLVGFGHPVGATGVKQIVEIHRQMKGKCEDYQVNRPLTHGITANMGGDDKTAVVTIFRNTTPSAHL